MYWWAHKSVSSAIQVATSRFKIYFFYILWQRSVSQFVQNGQQNDVLFVDRSRIGRIIKLSSVIGVSNIVDVLYPLVVELLLIIYILFQTYEVLKVVMSIIYVFLFTLHMSNNSPPKILWCNVCSGFYFLSL